MIEPFFMIGYLTLDRTKSEKFKRAKLKFSNAEEDYHLSFILKTIFKV